MSTHEVGFNEERSKIVFISSHEVHLLFGPLKTETACLSFEILVG